MIKATEFHHEFLKQLNLVNSGFNKRFSVATRDSYFNHAKDIVLENLFSAAEKNNTIKQHLRPFEVKREELTILKKTDDIVICQYPKDFYRPLRQDCLMTTKECKSSRVVIIRPIQSDDLPDTLKDPYSEPSFEWEETVGEEAHTGYYIYKKPEYNVDKVFMDYMRKPKDIAAPSLVEQGKSYINSRGETVKQDVDFEDSTYLWRKIVDVAVALALRDLGQLDNFGAQLKMILFGDSVYLGAPTGKI